MPARELHMSEEQGVLADLLVVLTEWNEFRALDLSALSERMSVPRMADLRNVYSRKEALAGGFTVYDSVGRVGSAALDSTMVQAAQ